MRAVGPRDRPRVLLVEDDADFAADLDRAFSRGGFEVALAGNFGEGADRAVTLEPDLIALDLHLPGDAALRLFRRIRSYPALRNTPVVAISESASGASSGRDRVRPALEMEGPNPPVKYFERPLDPAILVESVSCLTGSPHSRHADRGK